MVQLINDYLKEKELAWSASTLYSTKCTLVKLSIHLTGDPRVLWDFLLTTQQAYSRVTTWNRICSFWDFVTPQETNPYRDFRAKNARLFRNHYIKKLPTENVKEARKKIESIADPAIKRKALELLLSGMRWHESLTLKDGFIKGKGGYQRQVFMPTIEGPEYNGCYATFLRALKKVGLKPHSLRKINLTECVNNGANIFELQRLAGWKSLQSAASYIQVKQERLKEITENVRKKSL